MRKLTKNELVELRACKDMDNPQYEFFTRAKRMYDGDEEAIGKLNKVKDLFIEVEEMAASQDGGSKSAQGYAEAQALCRSYANELLKEMGFTQAPKRQPNDIFDVLEDLFGKPDE